MRGPVQPEKIITAGIIFVVTAVFIGAVAWMSLRFLRGGTSPGEATANAAEPGPVSNATQPTGRVLNATQVGEFLGLPTQNPPQQPSGTEPPVSLPTEVPVARPVANVDVDRLISEMSLEEKIGQMLMTGVPGLAMDAQAEHLIRDYFVGAVVYFGDNTRDPEQVRNYSRELQLAAAQNGRGIPLFIAVDHEGGRVFRFQNGMTRFPNPMALGAAHSNDLAFRVAEASARELKGAGINLNLGPVLDVNDEALNPVIGLRAFSGFADLASELGIAYIQGLQQNKVIAAAKHFPGHGGTLVDSHEALPVLNKSLAELEDLELAPFREAIQHGVGMVMVGHISLPQIDPSGRPASLSPEILNTLLRENLGYDGVVMTDAMSMGAIVDGYSVEEAAVGSVLAGCDLVAYTDMPAVIAARNALLQAVRTGEISEERINQAVRRIVNLKISFGLFAPAPVEPVADMAAHASLAAELSRRAITQVGADRLPLISAGGVTLITPDTLPVGSQEGDGLSLLGELLTNRGVQVDEWVYPVDNPAGIAAIQAEALTSAERYPQTLVVTWDALLNQAKGNPGQVNMITALETSASSLILIAAGSPFDLQLMGQNGVGLATYGSLPAQIEALVEALLAPISPEGTLPVPLSRE